MINKHSTEAQIRTEIIESGLSASDFVVASVRAGLTGKLIDMPRDWVGTKRVVRTCDVPR